MAMPTVSNPMTVAVDGGEVARVAALCRDVPRLVNTYDAGPGTAEDEQWLPLHRAAWAGHTEIVTLLLDHGAHVDSRTRHPTPDRARATALHHAAGAGRAAVATVLLERGAGIDLLDHASLTPLHYACLRGQWSTATLLCERGADVERRDELGRTPLLLAIAAEGDGANDTAVALVKHGADVNVTNPAQTARYTPLHACVDVGPSRLPVAVALLAAGADPRVQDPESRLTPRETARMFLRLGHGEYQAYLDAMPA